MMDVGFIGLGKMGSAMARNISYAGHRVRAWNRTPAPDEIVGTMEIVLSPRDALQGDAAFTMLSDDAAIRDVLLSSNALGSARPGLVHVVTSTISVELADDLRKQHADLGLCYVAAPVFGRPEAADAAQLNVVAAGAEQAIEKVRPLLDAIGRQTWVVGEDPKQANVAKVAGNMLIAMAIEGIAEALVMTERNGLGTETFLDLLLEIGFGCPIYRDYGAKLLAGAFEPGFRMRLGLKDLGLAADAVEQAGRTLPMLAAVRARMSEAVAEGLGDQDWSAVAVYTARR
jgi:3-hydroxyisobutyrate dehydrogenase-like beta-hydroxyacid dehydrogenase